MSDPDQPSPFIELVAVEAWDAWFRWRADGHLRDVSIEDTWRRVANCLAMAEPDAGAAAWRVRCMDALAGWRLLPDPRVLASAGTGGVGWRADDLHAAVNAAAFVNADATPQPCLALAALAECAELAVRALDNAARVAGAPAPRLRVGLVGIADALALLGTGYDSEAGRAHAARMARALAEGCLRSSIALAAARGACAGDTRPLYAHAAQRGVARECLRDAERYGLRHAQLTAVTAQPRLALLANDVADAADPLRGEQHAHVIAHAEGPRTLRSSGYALNVLREEAAPRKRPGTLHELSWRAQLSLRAALQPWLDEPIDYPLLASSAPDPRQRRAAQCEAALHGLGEPAWRDATTLLPA